MWEFQVPYFVDQGFRCVAYDRRGHGRSDWTWTGYDYDTLTDDLHALVNHLDLRETILIGHSAGTGEVVRYVSRYGIDRVAGIALVSGTTPFPMKTADNPEGIDRALMEADLEVRTRDRAKWFADHADGFFGIGLPGVTVSPEWREHMIRECLTCSAHATRAFFVTGFTSDLREDLRRLPVPTLIVHGTHDMQAPFALCGERTAKLVVLEFPDMDAARGWYRSAAYQSIVRLRTDNADGDTVLVEGVAEGHRATDLLPVLQSYA
jgi:pimeloyl-ACP methyl ester carboxylesterase